MKQMVFVSIFVLLFSVLAPTAMAGSFKDFDAEWPDAGVSAMASGARHACWGMQEGFGVGDALHAWLERLENADMEAVRLALKDSDEENNHE